MVSLPGGSVHWAGVDVQSKNWPNKPKTWLANQALSAERGKTINCYSPLLKALRVG